MALNNELISERPSQNTKQTILTTLFCPHGSALYDPIFVPFFHFYEEELFLQCKWEKINPGRPIAVKIHSDVLTVVSSLRQDAHHTKQAISNGLHLRFPNAPGSAVTRSIDGVMRLWLMMNVYEEEKRFEAPQTPVVSWRPDETLLEFISKTFPRSRCDVTVRDGRLAPSFNVAFMMDVCDLKIAWTNCLADHLRLDRQKRTLRIYPYKAVLNGHLEMSRAGTPNSPQYPLPQDLLLETIWTLNLLFPSWDGSTIALLKKHKQTFQQFEPFSLPAANLQQFSYWRDRLLELHDVVYSAPPVSWAQLWRDRRNPQQFWTFWIALAILVLTIISTVTSIIQAWASLKALNQD